MFLCGTWVIRSTGRGGGFRLGTSTGSGHAPLSKGCVVTHRTPTHPSGPDLIWPTTGARTVRLVALTSIALGEGAPPSGPRTISWTVPFILIFWDFMVTLHYCLFSRVARFQMPAANAVIPRWTESAT